MSPVSNKPPKWKKEKPPSGLDILPCFICVQLLSRFHDLPMVYLNCSCSQMCAYIETDQPFCRSLNSAWTQLVSAGHFLIWLVLGAHLHSFSVACRHSFSSSLCAFLIYTKPPFLVTCLVVLSPQSGQEQDQVVLNHAVTYMDLSLYSSGWLIWPQDLAQGGIWWD